jgi:hypothetical protein
MDETVIHMFEYHAINPEEMTSEMKSKIRENIHLYHNSLRAQILHDIPDVSEKYYHLFESDMVRTNFLS